LPHENDWLLDLARSYASIKGVVGWVDLCAPAVTARLEALAVHPQLKGFRHVVIDEPDEGFLLRDDFQRGIAALGPLGFTYDLLIFPRHVPAAVQLVRKFPQQRFVLDHLGLPDIRAQQLAPWEAGLKALGAFPNVFCKLSGLAYRADWQRWRPGDFAPHLDMTLERFGPGRLMVGSNWPVCIVAGAYDAVLDIVLDRVRALSQGEQAQILGGTCTDVYRLGPHTP
jgi:L-fuconolactonase